MSARRASALSVRLRWSGSNAPSRSRARDVTLAVMRILPFTGSQVSLPRASPPSVPDMITLPSQADISGEIASLREAPGRVQPRRDYPPYRSSTLRHPTRPLQPVDPEGVELWAPCFGHQDVDDAEADLTGQHPGEPIGERIVVTGRIVDGAGRPVAHQLVEV